MEKILEEVVIAKEKGNIVIKVKTTSERVYLEISNQEDDDLVNYVDWQYLGIDEYSVGVYDLLIICDCEPSVWIGDLNDTDKLIAQKACVKVFKKLYKQNKQDIINNILENL